MTLPLGRWHEIPDSRLTHMTYPTIFVSSNGVFFDKTEAYIETYQTCIKT